LALVWCYGVNEDAGDRLNEKTKQQLLFSSEEFLKQEAAVKRALFNGRASLQVRAFHAR
jgi:hypothetical protein